MVGLEELNKHWELQLDTVKRKVAMMWGTRNPSLKKAIARQPSVKIRVQNTNTAEIAEVLVSSNYSFLCTER